VLKVPSVALALGMILSEVLAVKIIIMGIRLSYKNPIQLDNDRAA